MRKAKEIQMYNNLGDIITITVPEFVKKHGLTKSQTNKLYTKKGWMDDQEVLWRIGNVPEFKKQLVTSQQKFLYNIFETDYLRALDGQGTSLNKSELQSAIMGYERCLEMISVTRKTNLHQLFKDNIDVRCKEDVSMNPHWIPQSTN